MVGCLNLKPDFVVLDVAAGTGHLGRAIAPRVQRVIAVDMTPEMLRQGIGEAARAGINNIVFEQGRAEKLPIPTTRLIWWSPASPCTTLPIRIRPSGR